MPIDAADIFPPAENLADEPFDAGDGCAFFAPSLLSGGEDLAGVEEFQIERGAEERVVKPRFARPHGILPAAEVGETIGDKVVEGGAGVGRSDGPGEIFQFAWMVCEACGDHVEDLAGERIGRKLAGGGEEAGTVLAEGFAVVVVEVPLAACGLRSVHEDACLGAQFSVKIFEAELFAVFRVGREFFHGAEKVMVGENDQWGSCLADGGGDFLADAPFAGLDDDDFFWVGLGDGPGELGGECFDGDSHGGQAGPFGGVRGEGAVKNPPTAEEQGIAKVAHCREENGDPRFGDPDFF